MTESFGREYKGFLVEVAQAAALDGRRISSKAVKVMIKPQNLPQNFTAHVRSESAFRALSPSVREAEGVGGIYCPP
jgi:uncharacterized protein YdeI (YjbR/CyaY-like superfamily)